MCEKCHEPNQKIMHPQKHNESAIECVSIQTGWERFSFEYYG